MMLHHSVSSPQTCWKGAGGLGEHHSLCFLALGLTKALGHGPAPALPAPSAHLAGAPGSLLSWHPARPELSPQHPGFLPWLPSCHIPGFPSTRQGKDNLAQASLKKKEKKAVFTEFKHGHTGKGYRQQINEDTEQTDTTFIYLLLKTTPKISVCAAVSDWQDTARG